MNTFVTRLIAISPSFLSISHASACDRTTDCVLPDGTYRVSLPPSWDSRRPLPVAIFFHGWQQTVDDVMRNQPLIDAFAATGSMLVVPNGLEKTWTVPGLPSLRRDDAHFALAVLADVNAHFPVDPRLV